MTIVIERGSVEYHMAQAKITVKNKGSMKVVASAALDQHFDIHFLIRIEQVHPVLIPMYMAYLSTA